MVSMLIVRPKAQASYKLDLPDTRLEDPKHLKPEVVQACLGGTHTPMNPHAQQLLAAAARAPKTLENKSDEKEEKAKKKQKKSKTEAERAAATPVPRTKYASVKKEFIDQSIA